MRNFIALAPPLVAIIAAAGGGWHWWSDAQYFETTDNAYVESDIAGEARLPLTGRAAQLHEILVGDEETWEGDR